VNNRKQNHNEIMQWTLLSPGDASLGLRGPFQQCGRKLQQHRLTV
jgi:hypothetical protein